MFSKKDLIVDLKNLGINKGDFVNVKASLKSIGKIEGGANTLVDSLLEVVGEKGGIMTESFIKMIPIFKLNKNNPDHISNSLSSSYAGAFTNVILKHPNSIVGNHPTHRYAGLGENLRSIITSHTVNDDPYLVLENFTKIGGKNLRIGSKDKVVGVGTTHIAINKSKIKQKRPEVGIYYKDGNELKLFRNWWASGCEKSFNNLIDYYLGTDAIISEGLVGNAESLLTNMEKTLAIEENLINSNPRILACNDNSCAKCRLGWEFSKGGFINCLKSNLLKKDFMGIGMTFYYYLSQNFLPKS